MSASLITRVVFFKTGYSATPPIFYGQSAYSAVSGGYSATPCGVAVAFRMDAPGGTQLLSQRCVFLRVAWPSVSLNGSPHPRNCQMSIGCTACPWEVCLYVTGVTQCCRGGSDLCTRRQVVQRQLRGREAALENYSQGVPTSRWLCGSLHRVLMVADVDCGGIG